ncbi:MAG: T9SS type A sorting domain-containing protein [Ignavibacteriota bacterium]
MKIRVLKVVIVVLIGILFYGWGGSGHKIINRKSIYSFPSVMNAFYYWSDSLSKHGSDADTRKSSDPTESPRHFIDIDTYPEFLANGRIPQSLDSLIAIHGSYFVLSNGTVPFAVIATTDSVRKYFVQHDWQKAMLKAADLGHYVADAHNPLHITENYDGQLTNQTGVHSRYETSMINADSSLLIYTGDSALYIPDINGFVFDFLYSNYPYVDSVLYADSVSHAIAGNYGSVYLQNLWQRAGTFTTKLFKNASNYLARLIYTAWINAGSPLPTFIENNGTLAESFELYQNYPNPFNPNTTIKFTLPKSSYVNLSVYDVSGKLVGVIMNEKRSAGTYSVLFNASYLSSGTYFYRLTAGDFSSVKRMILIK